MNKRLEAAEINAFFAAHFPQIAPEYVVEETGPMFARMRLRFSERRLRPGGTISGPTMFELADVALYAAIIAQMGVGDDPAMAHLSQGALTVTTNLNINFLRKPASDRDIIGKCKLALDVSILDRVSINFYHLKYNDLRTRIQEEVTWAWHSRQR